MILRIFATDGFTPERIFRWSVEETAAHLCVQQVLWVTRLDGPWQPLVEWFLKQPCCRAVCLDRADRWEWNAEHEITWRFAQGLYFKEGPFQEQPDAVCWIHDDMAPPECTGFKDFVRGWIKNGSTDAMAAPCYQLWNDFQTVRADKVGMDFAGDLHCWLSRWYPSLAWMHDANNKTLVLSMPGRASMRSVPTFTPSSATGWGLSPWPFRHAKGVEKNFREHNGFVRRGFPTERWRNAEGVRCVPYLSEITWADFKAAVST